MKAEAKTQTKCQIKGKTQIKALIFNKVFTIVLIKYFHYSNVFLAKNAIKLLKYTKIKNYIIKLKKNKQLSFYLIYGLKLIELEILKFHIKINLVNGFIRLFKFPAGIFILFNQRLNSNFFFHINHQSLNNLIINNKYFLPLIGKSLD